MPGDLTAPHPSDDDRSVSACGEGDVAGAVLSMGSRLPAGDDADYLQWHMLDHLPEQYRIAGFRGGQRWVSTPDLRAVRAASSEPFDMVDHVVHYLFAEPVEPALESFFELGKALFEAGRMPARWFGAGVTSSSVRRSHLGYYRLVGRVASPAALVGAAVLPWRPARGVYLLVERGSEEGGSTPNLADLTGLPGVAGLWHYRGGDVRREDRIADTRDLAVTVFYLEEDPRLVAEALADTLTPRWSGESLVPLLAAPFEIVQPWKWDLALP
jgi:hypothetical protein